MSIRIFGSALEKTDSSIQTTEAGENLFLFIICFLWSMYLHTVFLRCDEESNFLLELFKRIFTKLPRKIVATSPDFSQT